MTPFTVFAITSPFIPVLVDMILNPFNLTAKHAGRRPPGNPRSKRVSAMSMKGMTESVPGPPYLVRKRVLKIYKELSKARWSNIC